jgi:hypothetical protein
MPGKLHLIVAALLAAGSACAHRPPAGSAAAATPSLDSVTVNVTNTYSQSAVIYVRAGTHEFRMGTVEPGSTARCSPRRPRAATYAAPAFRHGGTMS